MADSRSLDLSQVAALLQGTPQMLRLLLTPLPKGVLIWRPQKGEWCINEVLGHLIEADRRGFDGRIRTMLAEERPQLTAWNVDQIAILRRDHKRDTFALLDELTKVRKQSAEMVLKLEPTQFNRSGIHPEVGQLCVSDVLYEWVHHDQNHIKQILANLQDYIWPALGNAQRFLNS